MKKIAIIGGTGLYQLSDFKILNEFKINSQYGDTSTHLFEVAINKSSVYFLSRHGQGQDIAPHLINYRANIDALKQHGISDIISINAVGAISQHCTLSSIIIPQQLIDYTHSREHTFFDCNQPVQYCDFSQPYTASLINELKSHFDSENISTINDAVYACTQGPRLETAAEIQKIAKDGCDIVGMTGMPEAVLAREVGINYASCCIAVNWASGIKNEALDMDAIKLNLDKGLNKINQIIKKLV